MKSPWQDVYYNAWLMVINFQTEKDAVDTLAEGSGFTRVIEQEDGTEEERTLPVALSLSTILLTSENMLHPDQAREILDEAVRDYVEADPKAMPEAVYQVALTAHLVKSHTARLQVALAKALCPLPLRAIS